MSRSGKNREIRRLSEGIFTIIIIILFEIYFYEWILYTKKISISGFEKEYHSRPEFFVRQGELNKKYLHLAESIEKIHKILIILQGVSISLYVTYSKK